MNLIAHRGLWRDRQDENTLRALVSALEAGFGIETDLRSHQQEIYLSHGIIGSPRELTSLESLLSEAKDYPQRPIFLNIKEDGLIDLLLPHKNVLTALNVVFFDMSVPELVQYARHFPPSMLAARVSDVEPHPSAISYCEWLWIDGFHRDLSMTEIQSFVSEFRRKCAFVSPELHGRDPESFWRLLGNAPFSCGEHACLCTDRCHEFREKVLG